MIVVMIAMGAMFFCAYKSITASNRRRMAQWAGGVILFFLAHLALLYKW